MKKKPQIEENVNVKKQKLNEKGIEEYCFYIGKEICYKTILASLLHSENNEKVFKWFEDLNYLLNDSNRIAVGLDCEWCPPWFRSPDQPEERICTMQFYNPNVGALILSTVGIKKLPHYLLEFFQNERILKVGVNIIGDGRRINRDFNVCVNGLINVEKLDENCGRMSMEKLVSKHCPNAFHISKDSIESKVRTGDWSKYPLDEFQVKYASLDAVLSFAIFLFQHKLTWNDGNDFSISDDFVNKVQSVSKSTQTPSKKSPKSNSNFFIMHRNRSIVPPNLNKKNHPKGTKQCLEGFVIVISGVLDSFSRGDFAEYVKQHGGSISAGITKSTSFLVNDHGTLGPSKVKKCQAHGIPVVSEDYILDLVLQSIKEK